VLPWPVFFLCKRKTLQLRILRRLAKRVCRVSRVLQQQQPVQAVPPKPACTSCHSTGAAGAPKVGDAAAWQARITARNKDGLYKSAIGGFNGMPAKGLCFACSDDELKGAVDYMLSKSK
jgi:cytochrome c5